MGKHVLFVCTGNTCRSALAEVLAADLLDQARRSEIRVTSAGTHASHGSPATIGARLVAAELGLHLEYHHSTFLDEALVATADHIFCMETTHLQAVQALKPDATVSLLGLEGSEIADPYGSGIDSYRTTRDVILKALAARLPELFADG